MHRYRKDIGMKDALPKYMEEKYELLVAGLTMILKDLS